MMGSLLDKYLGRMSRGAALALLGVGAACSSSSNSAAPAEAGTTGTSEGGASVDAGQPIIDADGSLGTCTPLTDEWVAAFITLNVSWAAVLAASGGTGPLYIWTLAHYTFNGSAVTGTSRTCGNLVPPLVLNDTGKMAENLPTTANVSILDLTPTTLVWDNDTRTAPTTGTLGGWNVGSSLTLNPTTSLAGIAATSTYANPSTPWPSSATSFMTSDLVNDDMDPNGNMGITAYPLDNNAMGYYLPATVLGSSNPPHADKLFTVSRNELSLYGTSASCTEISGTVAVQQYDLHVIGCHDVGTPASASCMASEWQFIDGNVTVYSGAAGKGTPITGTFDSKQLSADGGEPTCDDVVAAFPTPAMPTLPPPGDD
jgi:hypothetical protein